MGTRRLILFCLAAPVISVLTACLNNYHYPQLEEGDIVLAIGDQFTAGFNVSESFRYPAVLAKNTGAKVVNLGRSSSTVAEGLATLRANLPKYPNTKLIIVTLGYGEMVQGVDSRFVLGNFVELAAEAAKANTTLMLLGIPRLPYSKGQDTPLPLYEQLGGEGKFLYDRTSFLRVVQNPGNMETGGMLSADGYRVLAEQIEERLRKEGFVRN